MSKANPFAFQGRDILHYNPVCPMALGTSRRRFQVADVEAAKSKGKRFCRRCWQRNSPATTEWP